MIGFESVNVRASSPLPQPATAAASTSLAMLFVVMVALLFEDAAPSRGPLSTATVDRSVGGSVGSPRCGRSGRVSALAGDVERGLGGDPDVGADVGGVRVEAGHLHAQ